MTAPDLLPEVPRHPGRGLPPDRSICQFLPSPGRSDRPGRRFGWGTLRSASGEVVEAAVQIGNAQRDASLHHDPEGRAR